MSQKKSKRKSIQESRVSQRSVKPMGRKRSLKQTERKSESSYGDLHINLPDIIEGSEELEEPILSEPLRESIALSRTSLLALDYHQFKAARTIQTAARGWFVRHMLAKQTHAAKIIQHVWRGFYSYRKYYYVLEETLQKRLVAHYHRSATIIQALWRGWWVRENVHDHYRLARMQIRVAEDLLQCVAFKLHHMLRTYRIPGIYSLRNTHCLSKVEKLLAALSFKQYNHRVRTARARREAKLAQAKKKHPDSYFGTTLPYPGPNFGGHCDLPCLDLYMEADADKKMHKILSLYDRAGRHELKLAKIKHKTKTAPKKKKKKCEPDFCEDVVNSMKRWNILSANNRTVDPNVFRNPQNVEKFLEEIQSVQSLLDDHCNCNKRPLDEKNYCDEF